MGAGFKVWSTGDLVNASDFNNYLQEQVIMVFADASARNSAISSAEEGMFAFLKDTNVLTFYDGSSWSSFIGEGDITGVTITTNATGGLSGGATATSGAFTSTLTFTPNGLTAGTINVANDSFVIIDADDSNNPKKESIADFVSGIAGTNLTASSGVLNASGGKILQVVTGTSNTDTSVTSTSYTDSTLSASITPSATSSKILILVSQTVSVSRDSGNAIGAINIMRATTQIWEGYVGNTNNVLNQQSVMYLDSPSTTSATTYKTQGKTDTTSDSAKIRFQQDSGLSDRNSSIHLIEIGA